MLSNYLYKKEIKKYRKLVEAVNNLLYDNLSRDELITQFNLSVKNAISNNELISAYAVIKEVFKRTLHINLYDEQIIGAMAMFDGLFVEIDTGEGKTYVSAILSLIKSIDNKVYVITINDNLAERDYLKTKEIYDYLNISTGYNNTLIGDTEKQGIYRNSVIYSSTKELIFDYLRNNDKISDKLEIDLDYAIIDEVDFVLIDGANSTFSVNQSKSTLIAENISHDNEIVKYQIAKEIYDSLSGGILEHSIKGSLDESKYDVDYIFSKHNEKCYFTEKGMIKIENILKIKRLGDYNDIYDALINTIIANKSFIKNRDYIISNNKIVLINRDNGRKMANSQKEYHHQLALELKENVDISNKRLSSDTISYQVFFNLFKSISGMTGTIQGAEEEFEEIFQHRSFKVPRHFKLNRLDYGTKYFKLKSDKYKYLIDIIKKSEFNDRAILIICESEYEVFQVVKYIKNSGIDVDYSVLNSYNDECENEVIAKSGKKGSITITTNMLGRGTDIKIDQDVKEEGGLFVISMNKYSNLRIENQIRGRVGRQGEEGECLFLSSLEDGLYSQFDLYKINKLKHLNESQFYSDKIQRKIDEIAGMCQKYITSNLLTQRKYMYKISYMLYMQKQYLENKAIEFVTNDDICLLLNKIINDELSYLEEHDVILEEVLFFGERISGIEEIDIDNLRGIITNKVKYKIEYIGNVLSQKLLKDVYIELLKNAWDNYSTEIKKIALSNNLGANDRDEIFSKFIIQSNKRLNSFERYLNITTLEYFLKAEIKQRG